MRGEVICARRRRVTVFVDRFRCFAIGIAVHLPHDATFTYIKIW
jgi:hypothetical protein